MQYFFNECEHQLRKNVRFNWSANCFIYLEHFLSDFDDLFFFSLVFFHICSITFLLLSREFMKISRETRLRSLRKLINLICNKIVISCWECESRRSDVIMRNLEKNFFSRLQFDYTSLYTFISWSSELNLWALRFTNENDSRWKST